MKNLLNKCLIHIKEEAYLNLIIIIAPLLNFLSGISIDLYAPSLPAISTYYHASMMAAKNTVTAGIIGFSIGCIIFGAMLDTLGRRRTLLLGLTIFAVASFLAPFCSSIEQLIFLRFIQGMMVSTVSIGPRALIIDKFTDHRFNVAMLYTSVAYGLGPILGPFIGGILQYHFGWKVNFLAYGIFSISLLMLVVIYIDESLPNRQKFSLKDTFNRYFSTLKHRTLIAGMVIGGMIQTQFMIYPTVGPFIIEKLLHRSSLVYGNSALVISCGYLLGTLTNRLFIKRIKIQFLISFGFALLILALIAQVVFSFSSELSLFSLVLPITFLSYGNGFIFSNILAQCLRRFPNNAGVATAIFTCSLMAITAIGIFLISHINIDSLFRLSMIFAVPIIIQLCAFLMFLKSEKPAPLS